MSTFTPLKYSANEAYFCSEPIQSDHGANDRLRRARKEWFGFRPVDASGNLGPLVVVAKGNKRFVQIHPAKLFKHVLKFGAAGVLLVHNHPSGSLVPSRDDIELTNRVASLSRMLGLRCHGHFIVTRENSTFFRGDQ